MTYYMPAYRKDGISIVEIHPEYFNSKKPTDFKDYILENTWMEIIEKGWIETSWGIIAEEIKEKGELVDLIHMCKEWPTEIFGEQGKHFWYLGMMNQLMLGILYGDFEILQIFNGFGTNFNLMEISSKGGIKELIIETASEREFKRKLEEWVSKHQMRQLLKKGE